MKPFTNLEREGERKRENKYNKMKKGIEGERKEEGKSGMYTCTSW